MGLFGKPKKDHPDNLGITTSSAMSIEELYQAIKDTPFEAGKPELMKNLIVFKPYINQDIKIIIEGESGVFRCKKTDKVLSGRDLLGNVADDAVSRLISPHHQHRVDISISLDLKEKYGDLHNVIVTYCKSTVDTINDLNL